MNEKLSKNGRLSVFVALAACPLLGGACSQENHSAITNQPAQAASNQIASLEQKVNTNEVSAADQTVSLTNTDASLPVAAPRSSEIGVAAKERLQQSVTGLVDLALARFSNSISGSGADAAEDHIATNASDDATDGTVELKPRKGALEPRLGSSCEIKPNPELKGRLGRIVVLFPKDAKPSTYIKVCFSSEPEKTIAESLGEFSAELLPGQYVVYICGKRVDGVEVKARSDTRVRTGVLSIHLIQSTYVAVFDEGDKEKLTEGLGAMLAALPPGKVNVHVAGRSEAVAIKDGQVTDF